MQMLPCVTLHEAQHLAWLDPTARQSQPVRAALFKHDCKRCGIRVRWCSAAWVRSRFSKHVTSVQLAAESRLELPLWLAEPLHKRQHIELELPSFYGETYMQALRADAPHLDLRSQSDYYFDVGTQLAAM